VFEMNVRVAIVDVPSTFRTAVARTLQRDGGMTVEAFDDIASFARAPVPRPFAIALVSMDSIEAVVSLSRLTRMAHYAHLVAWDSDPAPVDALAAIRSGADGVLDKHASAAGLIRALSEIARGQCTFPRNLSSVIVEELQRMQRRSQAQARIALISRREREVLALLSAGWRNADIAEELGISELTAKRHVHNIFEKLSVSTRTAAARLGRDAGDELPFPASTGRDDVMPSHDDPVPNGHRLHAAITR
jgi:DNA-binding NarL/FixJ family response regulator